MGDGLVVIIGEISLLSSHPSFSLRKGIAMGGRFATLSIMFGQKVEKEHIGQKPPVDWHLLRFRPWSIEPQH